MLISTRVIMGGGSVKGACRLGSVCCFLFLWLLCVMPLYAQPTEKQTKNEVIVIGTGAIVNGNMAMAKGTAVSQSLKKGVEKYLLRRLGRQGAINNFQRLVEDVLPKAREEIENYHILAEGQIGNEYKVLMRIKINQEVMEEKLREAGLVLVSGPPLRILFLVSEKTGDKIFYWWKDPDAYSGLSPVELALHNVFQERGFSPINRTLSVPEIGYSDDLTAPDLDAEAVLKWGRLFSADVVFYGQVDMSEGNEILFSARAFDVDQGLMICEEAQSMPIQEADEGRDRMVQTLKRLVSHLAERAIPSIISTSASGVDKTVHLKIIVSGLNAYKQLTIFRDFLRKDIAGVKSVIQTRVRGSSVFLELEFEGNRGEFLNRVLNHRNLPLLLSHDPSEKEYILFKIE